jgi:hypothetical protein
MTRTTFRLSSSPIMSAATDWPSADRSWQRERSLGLSCVMTMLGASRGRRVNKFIPGSRGAKVRPQDAASVNDFHFLAEATLGVEKCSWRLGNSGPRVDNLIPASKGANVRPQDAASACFVAGASQAFWDLHDCTQYNL